MFCDKERLETLKQKVAGKEINIYDKHCLNLSKEEIEEKLLAERHMLSARTIQIRGRLSLRMRFTAGLRWIMRNWTI